MSVTSICNQPQKKERYGAFDGLRVLACIGIVSMHVKSNMTVKPSENLLTSNVISFAGDFVLLFMMISAFALSCGYYSKFESGSIKVSDFYKKRYTRILPFFALLTIIDVAKTIVVEHFAFTDALRAELYEAFTNCTLLFGLIPGNDISVVGVGWFLGVIFLFYLCYPFFSFLISSKNNVWIATFVSFGLYFSLEYYFYPVKGSDFGNSSFMKCAPFFMLGGLIFIYRRRIVDVMQRSLFRIALFIVTLGYTLYFFILRDLSFPLANLVLYSLWLIYAISEVDFSRKKTLLNNRIMNFLAGISMEVYLCHMMFFRVVEAMHIEKYVIDNNICYCLSFILVLSLAIIFSFFWKRICEPKVLKLLK